MTSAEASTDGLEQVGFDLAFLPLLRGSLQWVSLISLYGGSGLQEQVSQGKKNPYEQALIKSLLPFYLLVSHWPKQVIQPSPESMWEGTT